MKKNHIHFSAIDCNVMGYDKMEHKYVCVLGFHKGENITEDICMHCRFNRRQLIAQIQEGDFYGELL